MDSAQFMTLQFRILLTTLAAAAAASADDWPQWLGPQRDAVWRESGIIDAFPAQGPAIRWRIPIGAGYSGPAVAGGRVYVMDRQVANPTGEKKNAFDRGTIPGTERVLCFDETSGKLLWEHGYDCSYTVSYAAGPRATSVVADGRVYSLGTEGNLTCLEAESGKLVWERDFKKDFDVRTPMWGFAAHPLLDGNKLICLVGGKGSVAVAFDKNTGKELWRALTAEEPGYAPPVIYEAGGKRQLIVWHPEALNSLNPETGEVYWSKPVKARSGLSVAMPRKLGDLLYVTSFYNGSLMMRLDSNTTAASSVWQSEKISEKDTDALHTIMSTPFLEAGYIYGVCSYGQLRCLKADTGERVWETFAATTGKAVRWGNAFLVKNGDRFFLFNEAGDLIIAKLTPAGYEELSRAHILEPTNTDPGRSVVWSHPAFANRCVYARNDKELVCVSLAK